MREGEKQNTHIKNNTDIIPWFAGDRGVMIQTSEKLHARWCKTDNLFWMALVQLTPRFISGNENKTLTGLMQIFSLFFSFSCPEWQIYYHKSLKYLMWKKKNCKFSAWAQADKWNGSKDAPTDWLSPVLLRYTWESVMKFKGGSQYSVWKYWVS